MIFHMGGIAQLGEHELCKLGVTGSSPVASTIRRKAPSVRKRTTSREQSNLGPALSEVLSFSNDETKGV